MDLENNAGLKDYSRVQEAQIVGQPPETDGYIGKVKVINTMTGEIMERDYTSIYDVKNIYQELEGSKKAMDRAMKKLKSLLEHFMASYPEYEFPDGVKAKWITSNRTVFNYEDLKGYLSPEEIALVSAVSSTKLSEYLNQRVAAGEISLAEKDEIFATANVEQATSYLKLT